MRPVRPVRREHLRTTDPVMLSYFDTHTVPEGERDASFVQYTVIVLLGVIIACLLLLGSAITEEELMSWWGNATFSQDEVVSKVDAPSTTWLQKNKRRQNARLKVETIDVSVGKCYTVTVLGKHSSTYSRHV